MARKLDIMLQFLLGTLNFWTLIPNYGYLEEETGVNDWDSYSNEEACYFDTSEYQESWESSHSLDVNEDSSIYVNPCHQPGPFVNLCSQPPSKPRLIQNHCYQQSINPKPSYKSQEPWIFPSNPSCQNLSYFPFGSCSTTLQPIQSCHSYSPPKLDCSSNSCCSPMVPPLLSHSYSPYQPNSSNLCYSPPVLPLFSHDYLPSQPPLPNPCYSSPQPPVFSHDYSPLQPRTSNHDYSPQHPLNPCCSSPQPPCPYSPNHLLLEPSPSISCFSPSRPPCLSNSCSSSQIVCREKPKCQSPKRKCSLYKCRPKCSSHKRRRRTHRKKRRR